MAIYAIRHIDSGKTACFDAGNGIFYAYEMHDKSSDNVILLKNTFFRIFELLVFNNGNMVSEDTFAEQAFLERDTTRHAMQNSINNCKKLFLEKCPWIADSIVRGEGASARLKNCVVKKLPCVPYSFLFGDKDETVRLYRQALLNAERESGYGVDFKTLDDGNPLAQRYVFPNLSFQRGGGRLLSSRYDNFRRVVIAPAGIGKTSLLKAVMLHYAQNLPELGEQLGAADGFFPVFVRADKANSQPGSFSLFDLAFDAQIPFFKNLSAEGRLLMLIDGYDELSSYQPDTELESPLERFQAALRAFRQAFPKASVIVTSRFNDPLFEEFEPVRLERFTDEQIEKYLKKEVERNPSQKQRCDEITASALLKSLASSPFCLSELLRIHADAAKSAEALCDAIIRRRINSGLGAEVKDIRMALAFVAYDAVFVQASPLSKYVVSQDNLKKFFLSAAEAAFDIEGCEDDNDALKLKRRQLNTVVNDMLPIKSGILSRLPREQAYQFSANPLLVQYLAAAALLGWKEQRDGSGAYSAVAELVARFGFGGTLTEDILFSLALLFEFLNKGKDQFDLLSYIINRGFTAAADERSRVIEAADRIFRKEFGDNSRLDKKQTEQLQNALNYLRDTV